MLRFLANGSTQTGIARLSGKSRHTICTQLKSAKRKLDAFTTTEAVARALRRGWIE